MQISCTDGTIIECANFRAIDAGVLLFDESAGNPDEDDTEASGFVPITQLRYVATDDLHQRIAGGPQQPQQQMTQGQMMEQQQGRPPQQMGNPGQGQPDVPPQ